MCRSYHSRSVPEAQILRILQAARKSPSAGHAQGVRFAVLTDSARRQEIASAYGEEDFVARGFAPWLSVAPVHVVVAVSSEAYQHRYSEPDKTSEPQDWPVPYSVMDAGKALMSLYLAAESFGLACGYLGPHAGPDLVTFLGLPADWEFMGLVTLGYRDRSLERRTRSVARGWREFDEVVIWNP